MSLLRPIPFALLVGGALAFAPVPAAADTGEGSHHWESPNDDDALAPDGAEHVRQKLAEKFDVPDQVIVRLRESGMGYGEIDHALTLADRLPGGINRENVREIVEMRDSGMGWGQIAHELDTTMGAAKRDFGTPPSSDGTAAQPTSVSRSGKSSHAAAEGSSAHGLGARSFTRSGSNAAAKMSGSRAAGRMSAARMGGVSGARAGGGAFGGGSSQGGGGSASAGRAIGRK